MASFGKAKMGARLAVAIKEPKSMHLREAAEGGVIAEHGMEPPHHFGAGEHKALAAHIAEHFGMNSGEPEDEGGE